MEKRERAILESLKLLFVPYIWAGNDPNKDGGVDCSGFVGYILKGVGILPKGYDNTAHGYYRKYAKNLVDVPLAGCLLFYGRPKKIVHVMLSVSNHACIGAVRGNRHIDTIAKAKQRNAGVYIRKIRYRNDLVAICDPFKGGCHNG